MFLQASLCDNVLRDCCTISDPYYLPTHLKKHKIESCKNDFIPVPFQLSNSGSTLSMWVKPKNSEILKSSSGFNFEPSLLKKYKNRIKKTAARGQ